MPFMVWWILKRKRRYRKGIYAGFSILKFYHFFVSHSTHGVRCWTSHPLPLFLIRPTEDDGRRSHCYRMTSMIFLPFLYYFNFLLIFLSLLSPCCGSSRYSHVALFPEICFTSTAKCLLLTQLNDLSLFPPCLPPSPSPSAGIFLITLPFLPYLTCYYSGERR